MQRVAVSGVELEYYRVGRPGAESTTLVFLHDGLGSALAWRDLPSELADALDTDGLVFSRCGYGGSDQCGRARDREYMHVEGRSVVPELLRATGVRDHAVIGHSDGASISLLYAATQPPGLRAVVAIAPHVVVEERTLHGIEAAVEAYGTTDWRRRLERHHGSRADFVFGSWSETWLAPWFRDWSIVDDLARITCPTCVVQGSEDNYGSLVHLREIVDRVSGPVEGHVIPGSGHSPHRDKRLRVVELVSGFLMGAQEM